jgi:hypothetical protein
MSNTAFLYPQTLANNATSGANAWANVANASGNDGICASGMVGGPGPYQDEAGCRIVIDAAGVAVVSVAAPAFKKVAISTSAMTVGTYGGATDRWGYTSGTITPAMVNHNNFGVGYMASGMGGMTNFLFATKFAANIPTGAVIDGIEFQVERGSHGSVPVYSDVDYIALKVYYTDSADVTAPVVTITTPTSGTTYTTSGAVITLAGTATDAVGVSSVKYANGAATGNCAGTTSWSGDIDLNEGLNSITITASDAANNNGTDSIDITYVPPADTTDPSFTFVTPSGTVYTSSITLQGTASDNVGVVQVRVSNLQGSPEVYTAAGTTSWSCNVPLVVGINNLYIWVYDAAGNNAQGSISITYQLNTPRLTILSPTVLTTTDSFVYVGGSVVYAPRVIKCVGETNDNSTSTTAQFFHTQDNITFSMICLLELGDNVLTLSALDESDVSICSDTITITRTGIPPIDTTTSTTGTYTTTDTSMIVSGIAASGTTSVIWVNEQTGTSGIATGTTTWTADVGYLVGDTNHLLITAVATGGNTTSVMDINSSTANTGTPVYSIDDATEFVGGTIIRPFTQNEGKGWRARGLYIPKTITGAVYKKIAQRLHVYSDPATSIYGTDNDGGTGLTITTIEGNTITITTPDNPDIVIVVPPDNPTVTVVVPPGQPPTIVITDPVITIPVVIPPVITPPVVVTSGIVSGGGTVVSGIVASGSSSGTYVSGFFDIYKGSRIGICFNAPTVYWRNNWMGDLTEYHEAPFTAKGTIAGLSENDFKFAAVSGMYTMPYGFAWKTPMSIEGNVLDLNPNSTSIQAVYYPCNDAIDGDTLTDSYHALYIARVAASGRAELGAQIFKRIEAYAPATFTTINHILTAPRQYLPSAISKANMIYFLNTNTFTPRILAADSTPDYIPYSGCAGVYRVVFNQNRDLNIWEARDFDVLADAQNYLSTLS